MNKVLYEVMAVVASETQLGVTECAEAGAAPTRSAPTAITADATMTPNRRPGELVRFTGALSLWDSLTGSPPECDQC
jgi:hypothetical protein